MPENLTPLQIATALSEDSYRRSDSDQAITLADLSQNATDVALRTTPQGLTTDGSGYWYDDSTGFVGRVVSVNGTIYVVFRGTDIGTAGSLSDTANGIANLLTTGTASGPVG